MGQTFQSQCLMTSRRIAEVIDRVVDKACVRDEREFAVIAAIKLGRPEYRDCSMGDLTAKMTRLGHVERRQLARDIHPVLCALTVEQQCGESGTDRYCVQILNPRGVSGRLVVFDINAREVEAA